MLPALVQMARLEAPVRLERNLRYVLAFSNRVQVLTAQKTMYKMYVGTKIMVLTSI